MKTRMNVTKKEAKQISCGGISILYNNYRLFISKEDRFEFSKYRDYNNLSWLSCYKDYEWRLTDIKDLKQGDICKVIYKCLPNLYIYVFDKITEHYIDVGDEDYEHKTCALMWGIGDNRPVKDYPFENVYKLFKKEMK